MSRIVPLILALFGSGTALADEPATPAEPAAAPSAATGRSASVRLYFFWSSKCPHCLRARPFVENLDREHAWIRLESYDVTASHANARLFVERAEAVGQSASSVPSFIFCDQMLVGYQDAETTGAELLQALTSCRDHGISGETASANAPKENSKLPSIDGHNLETGSLLMVTFMLAGLDAFNPCAFFVLLFLLSLMIHTANRVRLLLIGGIFVITSGTLYFLFMAAWLNAFLLFGSLAATTTCAGVLALLIGCLNVKDYFLAQSGPTLSMSSRHRSRLFERVRDLLSEGRTPALVVSTVVLAVAANSYELLCTVGFPMVYTRILTLHALPPVQYYGWLVLYNLIYVLPLLLIVAGFAFALGSRKLSEREGRVLKLLSGLLMSALGGVLLLAPLLLEQLLTSAVIVVSALALTALLVRLRPPA